MRNPPICYRPLKRSRGCWSLVWSAASAFPTCVASCSRKPQEGVFVLFSAIFRHLFAIYTSTAHTNITPHNICDSSAGGARIQL
ncbi:hypothetical protein BKA70DRAFT_1319207 [Coprinopsis sp. MPI-PUGE-AT-0042]|nr:hypothetical protein BKA70DRAFT_1319207 [Coprinopsis sp. MPI-PUGE-AT-0042]